MIAKVLYGNYPKGILDYVIDKNDSEIIGFGNTYSKYRTSRSFFQTTLEFLASRNTGDKNITHIALNLATSDNVSNDKFYDIAKDYMEGMGYADQPFIVVKHNDKKHKHVHIVTTRVKEDTTKVSMSRDFLKSMELSDQLEKKYNLTPTNHTRIDNEMPIVSNLSEIETTDDKGLKYYLEDTITRIIQKYQITSFKQLEKEIEKYSIKIAVSFKENDRVGVSFGIIDPQNKYNDRVIPGSKLHKKLSFPNLNSLFLKNKKSPERIKRRKILQRELSQTFSIFKNLPINELPTIAKEFNNINIRLNKSRESDKIIGYTIYDKTGYIFTASEIDRTFSIGNTNNPISTSGRKTIDIESPASLSFMDNSILDQLEIYHLENTLDLQMESEHYSSIGFKDIQANLQEDPKFLQFYRSLTASDKKKFLKIISERFEIARDQAIQRATKRESFQLNKIANTYSGVFDYLQPIRSITPNKLAQSIGGYLKEDMLSIQGNPSFVKRVLQKSLKDNTELYTYNPTGFQTQNLYVLSSLVSNNQRDIDKVNQTSFFLPMLYPEIYESLNTDAYIKIATLQLEKYIAWETSKQMPFITTALELSNYLANKGFLIEKTDEHYTIRSAYTGQASVPLPAKIEKYLHHSNDAQKAIETAKGIFIERTSKNQFTLDNLWATHLSDKGIYDKCAYLVVKENATLLYDEKALAHHNEQGLLSELKNITNYQFPKSELQKMSRTSRGISALLSNSQDGQQRVLHNGFKDELTDYSKYRGMNF